MLAPFMKEFLRKYKQKNIVTQESTAATFSDIGSIGNLPFELFQYHILPHLSLLDIFSLACTSQFFHHRLSIEVLLTAFLYHLLRIEKEYCGSDLYHEIPLTRIAFHKLTNGVETLQKEFIIEILHKVAKEEYRASFKNRKMDKQALIAIETGDLVMIKKHIKHINQVICVQKIDLINHLYLDLPVSYYQHQHVLDYVYALGLEKIKSPYFFYPIPMNNGETRLNLLTLAILCNQTQVIDHLSSQLNDDLFILEPYLMTAVRMGNISMVDKLLKSGAQPNSAVFGLTNSLNYSLHLAVVKGHLAIAKLLIDYGAYINTSNRLKQTPFSLAIQIGHGPLVWLLLDRGANPNYLDYDSKETPLEFAIRYKQTHIENILVKRGAHIGISYGTKMLANSLSSLFFAPTPTTDNSIHKLLRHLPAPRVV
jgi:hypothetical protein